MSYTINLTNGTRLTAVKDGGFDQITTSLALIGKNSTSYGTLLNDNFVHLLENFANTSEPTQKLTGQLWYDTSDGVLKVYNGYSFVPTGSTIVKSTMPTNMATGALWVDNVNSQLYFNDGASTILAGPVYTSAQGKSGFIVQDVIDANQINHTVVLLYVAQVLIGVFSKDVFEVPSGSIPGFSGTMQVGFNAGTYTGVAFDVPVSQAFALLAADGTIRTAESFMQVVGNTATTGTMSIQNAVPLILGPGSNSEIDVTSDLFQIRSNSINQNFQISALNSVGLSPAIFVNATSSRVGIFNDTPEATLDVNGDVIIEGNLTVRGASTTINTTDIEIADKFITLGATNTPTDITATGGGIKLDGATTKSILWANSSWTSSENFNLASTKTYKVNGIDVLTGNSLGAAVVNILGTLTGINISGTASINNLALTNSSISYVNASNVNGDVVIVPKGTGAVNVSSAKIINVATPAANTDAANKAYVDTATTTVPLSISLTTTGLTNVQIATNYLAKLFPNAEHRDTTVCRVICTDTGTVAGITSGPGSSPLTSFVTNTTYVITAVGTTDFTLIGASSNTVGTVFVATGTGTGSGTANPVLRRFELAAGIWSFQYNF